MIDELVKEILEIVNTLSEQNMGTLSQDTLARLALKLASYKASLGEHVSIALKEQLDAEARYYEARAKEYARLRDEGKGSTDAGELKHLNTAAMLSWNQCRYTYKRLSQLSSDCHDLIDSITGRLIMLHQERKESHV